MCGCCAMANDQELERLPLSTEETAMSEANGGVAERRVYMRWSVGIPVRVEADGKIAKCGLENISGSGACAWGRVRASKGDEIVLQVSVGRSISAKVVRVSPSEIGMEFLIDDRQKNSSSNIFRTASLPTCGRRSVLPGTWRPRFKPV